MPFFITVTGTAQFAELTHFVVSNHGLVLETGWYLLPWSGVPDVLTTVVHGLLPLASKGRCSSGHRLLVCAQLTTGYVAYFLTYSVRPIAYSRGLSGERD